MNINNITQEQFNAFIKDNNFSITQEIFNLLEAYEKNNQFYLQVSFKYLDNSEIPFNTLISSQVVFSIPNSTILSGTPISKTQFSFSLLDSENKPLPAEFKKSNLTVESLPNFTISNIQDIKTPTYYLIPITLKDYLKLVSQYNKIENAPYHYYTFGTLFKSKPNNPDLFNKVLNILIENASLPKKIPSSELLRPEEITKHIYKNSFPLFSLLSQCKLFHGINTFNPTKEPDPDKHSNLRTKHILKLFNNINQKLFDHLEYNIYEDKPFETGFINFCKKHKSHIFNKDLSHNPIMKEFYLLTEDLMDKYPNIDTQIRKLTNIFNEKNNGISLTVAKEKCVQRQAELELFYLDVSHIKEVSSAAFFNKFKFQFENIFKIIFEVNNYTLVSDFTERKRESSTYAVIQKNKDSQGSLDKIWADFELILNKINKEDITINVDWAKIFLLEKQLEIDSPETENKNRKVNKF